MKIILSLLFISIFILNPYKNNIIPVSFLSNYIQYKKEVNIFENAIKQRIQKKSQSEYVEQKNTFNDSMEDIINLNKTIIIIIGESASRHHQSIYHYSRKTNPLLEKIKNELYVFDNVISPHANTNQVLSKVLTFANFENMEYLNTKPSIIEYMKHCGYKTFWLSNQQFNNINTTVSTSIAKQADYYTFTNTDDDESLNNFDGDLLQPLQKTLQNKHEKKFIVIHLMGSHSNRENRYPIYFDKFKDSVGIPKLPHTRRWVIDQTNAHDNSVLYTDWIISQIIKKVKAQNDIASVLYFADHGEEIFEYRDFMGHAEANAGIYTFDIPFVLWLSDSYKTYYADKVKNLINYVHRKYQTDDVIHSIIDLSNCYSEDFIPAKSVFNPGFKFEKRFIAGEDYDQMILTKKSITD